MLIQVVTSTTCRGWEGNYSEIIETEFKTVKKYVDSLLKEEQDDGDGEEGDYGSDDCFGLQPGGSERHGYHVQWGEEVCKSYYKFVPTEKLIKQLRKYVK